MNFARRMALAGILAIAAATPAMADEWWTYRGGPKGPPSLTSPDYAGGYAYYGGPYAGPGYAYGGAYAYSGPEYGGYGYRGRVNEPLYRCTGPATSDCYNSRALQGSR